MRQESEPRPARGSGLKVDVLFINPASTVTTPNGGIDYEEQVTIPVPPAYAGVAQAAARFLHGWHIIPQVELDAIADAIRLYEPSDQTPIEDFADGQRPGEPFRGSPQAATLYRMTRRGWQEVSFPSRSSFRTLEDVVRPLRQKRDEATIQRLVQATSNDIFGQEERRGNWFTRAVNAFRKENLFASSTTMMEHLMYPTVERSGARSREHLHQDVTRRISRSPERSLRQTVFYANDRMNVAPHLPNHGGFRKGVAFVGDALLSFVPFIGSAVDFVQQGRLLLQIPDDIRRREFRPAIAKTAIALGTMAADLGIEVISVALLPHLSLLIMLSLFAGLKHFIVKPSRINDAALWTQDARQNLIRKAAGKARRAGSLTMQTRERITDAKNKAQQNGNPVIQAQTASLMAM